MYIPGLVAVDAKRDNAGASFSNATACRQAAGRANVSRAAPKEIKSGGTASGDGHNKSAPPFPCPPNSKGQNYAEFLTPQKKTGGTGFNTETKRELHTIFFASWWVL